MYFYRFSKNHVMTWIIVKPYKNHRVNLFI